MLKIKLTIALIILFTGFSFAQNADIILGKYLLPNDLEVELFKKDGKYFGKIVGLNNYQDGEKNDVKNSNHTNHRFAESQYYFAL